MFWSSWSSIGRIIIAGIFAYLSIVVSIRISGKRTLSKLNAFDFVVTVALGSILATMITTKDFKIVDGIASFAILMILQYIISSLSVRSRKVEKIVKAEPTLLFYNNEFLEKNSNTLVHFLYLRNFRTFNVLINEHLHYDQKL